MSKAKSKDGGICLNGCVRQALEKYFHDLDGHVPGNLYPLLLNEVERPLLEVVMGQAKGNQTHAAQILGINRATLRKKLKHYGIDK